MSPIKNGILERIFDRLYDTVTLPAGPMPKKITLFSNPVGMYVAGRQRLWADTNMYMSGSLPAPMRFRAKRLRIEILAAGDSDLDQFKRNCSLRFHVGHKKYFEAPVSTLILEDWIRLAVSQIGNDQAKEIGPYLDRALANGSLGIAGLEQEHVLIDMLETFSVEIQTDVPLELTQPLCFRVFIEGPEFRAVC